MITDEDIKQFKNELLNIQLDLLEMNSMIGNLNKKNIKLWSHKIKNNSNKLYEIMNEVELKINR